MAKFKPYFELSIPSDYSPEERRAIAAEIIDYVITRTENGKDANGRGFKKYSETYAKEKGQTNIDLTFSGDMLSEMRLLKENKGNIRIGYSDEYEGLAKLEGNVLGTYGDENRRNKKPRNFLGITQKDLKSILSKYPLRDEDARRERVDAVKDASIVAESILSNSGFDDGQDS